jgi:hypothetical protein
VKRLAFGIYFDSACLDSCSGLSQPGTTASRQLRESVSLFPDDESHQGLQSGVADKVSEPRLRFAFLLQLAGAL